LKISEKAALAMAGYTKAEIEAMEKPAPQPAPQPVPQPVPQPAPQPVPQPTPQPAPQPAPQYDGLETLLREILQGQQTSAQAMQTMTQTLQANALGLGIQQQPAADAATVTARIIDPTYGKEVK
jgi:outer membrane biosynthesis protein TonB